MARLTEVVISGVGIVSPLGIGRQEFWSALREGQSGVRPIASFDARSLPVKFAAEVIGFDPKKYVRPRKSLKVMSRDIQLGFAAADLAYADAGLSPATVSPDRLGVVFGSDMIYCEPLELTSAYRSCVTDGRFDFDQWGKRAIGEMYPLWMLKYLPNMPACHIAIAHDARGPNNSIILSEVSSLLALTEAMRVIERGQADVVITGGTGCRVHPTNLIFRAAMEMSRRGDDPAGASRPFDADRDGVVHGEGAAAFILESRRHAEARGAAIQARILGYSSTFEAPANGRREIAGRAIRASIANALKSSGLSAAEIGHVNAHGLSSVEHDRTEAQAIRDTLGDVPVTALKSFFGNLGAGTGAVEMAASVLSFAEGEIPQTLNYETPDPECPVNVVREPQPAERKTALLLNQATTGQAVAVVIAAE